MTYNEWRDELKSNLLSVSESERRRVLDYYAEAYADRRDAGFTEREIIQDFGAPYDAAQRILSENRPGGHYDEYYDEPRANRRDERARREEEERLRREEQARRDEERLRSIEAEKRRREQAKKRGAGGFESYNYAQTNTAYPSGYTVNNGRNTDSGTNYANTSPAPAPAPKKKEKGNFTWVFVLLCIIFAVPICGVIIAMVGITVSVCVAPFATLISGVAAVGSGIGTMVAHGIAAGLCETGAGIIICGVSIALIPLFVKLIKIMWTLFGKFFRWLKSLFSGKEGV